MLFEGAAIARRHEFRMADVNGELECSSIESHCRRGICQSVEFNAKQVTYGGRGRAGDLQITQNLRPVRFQQCERRRRGICLISRVAGPNRIPPRDGRPCITGFSPHYCCDVHVRGRKIRANAFRGNHLPSSRSLAPGYCATF